MDRRPIAAALVLVALLALSVTWWAGSAPPSPAASTAPTLPSPGPRTAPATPSSAPVAARPREAALLAVGAHDGTGTVACDVPGVADVTVRGPGVLRGRVVGERLTASVVEPDGAVAVAVAGRTEAVARWSGAGPGRVTPCAVERPEVVEVRVTGGLAVGACAAERVEGVQRGGVLAVRGVPCPVHDMLTGRSAWIEDPRPGLVVDLRELPTADRAVRADPADVHADAVDEVAGEGSALDLALADPSLPEAVRAELTALQAEALDEADRRLDVLRRVRAEARDESQ